MYQILTWSATCCMWRVEKVSKWEDKKNLLLGRVPKKSTRQTMTLPCVKKSTRQSISLPCAKKSTRQIMTLPCALVLPCVFLSTLGKNHVCRVPVNLHTANYGAHDKIEVSGSDGTEATKRRCACWWLSYFTCVIHQLMQIF